VNILTIFFPCVLNAKSNLGPVGKDELQ